jgi:hypothetical protein
LPNDDPPKNWPVNKRWVDHQPDEHLAERCAVSTVDQ